MANRKTKAEEMGIEAKRALAFVDRMAKRDQLALGVLVGYGLKKAAELEPESLAIVLTGALVKLSELNRPAYDGLGAQIVWNTLKDSGFLEVLAEIRQKAGAGDAQGVLEVAERIGVLVKGIETLANGGKAQALIEAQEATGISAGKPYVM